MKKRNRSFRSYFLFCVFAGVNLCLGIARPQGAKSEDTDGNELIKRADSLFLYAQYNEAVHHYEKSMNRSGEEKKWGDYVRVLNRLTDLYMETDDWSEAIHYNQEANESAELYLEESHPERIYCHINRGRTLSEEGYCDQAREIFEVANEDLLNGGFADHHYTAIAYSCMAEEYDHVWDFNRAIYYHTMALTIDRNLYPENHPVIAGHLGRLGETAIYAGESKESLRNIRKSLRIYLMNYGEEHPKTGKAFADIANFYFYERERDSVEIYSEKALKILQRFLPENHFYFALVHQRLAYHYEFWDDFKKAISHIKRAIFILESRDIYDHRRIAWSYNWLQKIYGYAFQVKTSHYYQNRAIIDSAYFACFKGLQAIQPEFTDTGRFALPKIDNLIFDRYMINLLLNRSSQHLRNFRLTGTIRYLEGFCDGVSMANKLYQEHLQKRTIRKGREDLAVEISRFFGQASLAALELYLNSGDEKYLEKYFLFSEENKSHILTTLRFQSNAVKELRLPDSLEKKEKSYRDRINALEVRIYGEKTEKKEPDSLLLAGLYVEICKTLEEYDRFKNGLKGQYRDYRNVSDIQPVVKLEDLKGIMDHSHALVTFEVVEHMYSKNNYLISCFITADTIMPLVVPLSEDFYSGFEIFRSSLCNPAHEEAPTKNDFLSAARNLFDVLLQPGRGVITGKDLVIVPDEWLCHIPFEALVTREPGPGAEFRDLPWLIREHAVSYASSATLYYEGLKHQDKKTSSNTLLAFASVTEKQQEYSDKLIAEWISRGEDLGALKESKSEVAYIQGIFGGRIYTGLEATEAEFKQNAGQYEMIHIATHGIVDDAFPMNSKLLFAKDPAAQEDGCLNVYELYAMDLQAKMAVLSACNTGYGKIQNGEGVISLARGFAYAGVPSVVMSLWKVRDRSTSLLMQKFYTHLKAGKTKDRALQLAKLEYLEGSDPFFSHPHFWAGFVHVGDARALETIHKNNILRWEILIPVIALAGGIILLWRKRRYFRTNPKD